MPDKQCPTCLQLRDTEASGKSIDEEGVCGYCLLALQQNMPLMTVGGAVSPRNIALYVVRWHKRRGE